MNNNKVIRRTCLLVRRSVLYMLGKPACSGFCNTTVLARLFRFHCWNRAAFSTSNNIHVQTTPTIHEYYCSRSWAVESDWSVGKLWMALFGKASSLPLTAIQMWPPANALIFTRPCLNNRFQLAAEVVYTSQNEYIHSWNSGGEPVLLTDKKYYSERSILLLLLFDFTVHKYSINGCCEKMIETIAVLKEYQ